MKGRLFTVLLFCLCLFSCTNYETKSLSKEMGQTDAKENFGLVIHGGAGTILKKNMSDSLEHLYDEKLKEN